MEIILKQDMPGLGYANDIVTVKPGYGRNYLIPNKIAIIASSDNLKVHKENVKQAAHKAAELKSKAEESAKGIEGTTLVIKAKVGEKGKIFGAVTTLQLSDALKDKGYEVDRKRIKFTSDVKMVGEYEAVAELHKDVTATVKFAVEAE